MPKKQTIALTPLIAITILVSAVAAVGGVGVRLEDPASPGGRWCVRADGAVLS